MSRGAGRLSVRHAAPGRCSCAGLASSIPASGIDARLDVLVRGGEIAALGDDLDAPDGAR